MSKNKVITFRPDMDVDKIIEQAKEHGTNITTFINNKIRTGSSMDFDSRVLIKISRLQTILEFAKEPLKSQLREELNELCRILRS